MDDTRIIPSADAFAAKHRAGFEALEAFWGELNEISRALSDVATYATESTADRIEEIQERITAFEPSVSIIGQVKAGKSSLVNALIGTTSLLPSDVNPWTSVITSIHLNSRQRPADTRALFRFFDALEWDRLVTTGGRLGEMADRAGFEGEAAEIRSQVMKMREATEGRLGTKFERLLGTSHAYPELSKELIDRYVCYGQMDEDPNATEGFYADITKSADLFIDLPGYPSGLSIRDTPGVNDTFMMREQITINAISESRVCVIVLSAHQALSTMDMALLRIICNVEAREVLFFVNRIDELNDPVNQTREIEASIRKTLERFEIDPSIDIIFGSAYWATHALNNTCDKMSAASVLSLGKWVSGMGHEGPIRANRTRDLAYDASGVGQLHRAIAARVVEGPGKWMLSQVTAEAQNVALEMEVVGDLARGVLNAKEGKRIDEAAIRAKAEAISVELAETMDSNRDAVLAQLRERLARSQDQFVETAIDALASHIKAFGEVGSWKCDPTSFRMLMRSAYMSNCVAIGKDLSRNLFAAEDRFRELVRDELNLTDRDFSFELPLVPATPPTTVVARTISLDMQPNWWRRFFAKSRDAEMMAKKYEAVIRAETAPIIESLISDLYLPYAENCAKVLADFCVQQVGFVGSVLEAIKQEQHNRAALEVPAARESESEFSLRVVA